MIDFYLKSIYFFLFYISKYYIIKLYEVCIFLLVVKDNEQSNRYCIHSYSDIEETIDIKKKTSVSFLF